MWNKYVATGILVVGLATALVFTGCDISSSLMSESERSSIYTIGFSSKGQQVAEGAALISGTTLSASLSRITGSVEPGSLEIELMSSEGASLPLQRIITDSEADAVGLADSASRVLSGNERRVPRLDGSMPQFALPAGLEAGAYWIVAQIKSPSGAVLQRYEKLVFIGVVTPVIDSVSVYPPAAEPGMAVLLTAVVAGSTLAPPAEEESPSTGPDAETPEPTVETASSSGQLIGDAPAETSSDALSAAPGVDASTASVAAETGSEASTAVSETSVVVAEAPDAIPTPAASEILAAVEASDPLVPSAVSEASEAGESAAGSAPSASVAPTAALSSESGVAASSNSEAAGSPFDPWLRWSRDGKVFAEGSLSSGFDKVVWKAPAAEGAYVLRLEVYPAAPPEGSVFDFDSDLRQDIKAIVKIPPGGTTDEFADAMQFHSLLRFDGGYEDSGTREIDEPPAAFGSPAIATYQGGFGYRFDAETGVAIPGLWLPLKDGKADSFALAFRLALEQRKGSLVRFVSDDASFSFTLGLDEGKPYVEYSTPDGRRRSTAPSEMPKGAATLVAALKAEGESLRVSFIMEGDRVEAQSLPLPLPPEKGSALVGGADSASGVYDDFGLAKGDSLPWFRSAARRRWRASLIAAESFEEGALPPSTAARGEVAVQDGAVSIGPQASLAFSPSIRAARAVAVEAVVSGDIQSAYFDLESASGERIFSLRFNGTVIDREGKVLGSVSMSALRPSFVIATASDGLRVYSSSVEQAVALPRGSTQNATLVVRRSDGTGKLLLERIMIRETSSKSRASQ